MNNKKTKNLYFLVGLGIAFVIALSWDIAHSPERSNIPDTKEPIDLTSETKNNTMIILSTAFKNGDPIPQKYTCDGENINPPLRFENVPKESRSLSLILEDPDVPTTIRNDGVWDHWLIWNIPPEDQLVGEGQSPLGISGLTTSNKLNYGGPCPPDKEHRYFFKLYALDALLSLEEGASKKDLLTAMEGHILEVTELVGTYERK